jgi:hypothetical protein
LALYDLKASGENSCVTVNSREGERINVFEERSLNDDPLDASLCTMSMRDPQALNGGVVEAVGAGVGSVKAGDRVSEDHA